MAGYQTLEALRPILSKGPPPMPVVDRALVRSREPQKQIKAHRNASPSADTKRYMRERRAVGTSIHTIARETGFTHTTVLRWTRDVPEPEGGWQTGARTSTLNRPFAMRLHRAGFTYREIGENIGCCESAAHRIIHGVRCRTRGPQTPTSRIVQAVHRVTGVPRQRIRKPLRERELRVARDIGQARAIVFWVMRRDFPEASFAQIGKSLGGFDHTSVLYGTRRIDQLVADHSLILPEHPGRVARILWGLLVAETSR